MSIAQSPLKDANHRADFEVDDFATESKTLFRWITRNWDWILAAGVISVVGGVAALLAPVLATGIAGTLIAGTLLVVGCFNLVGSFYAEKGMKLGTLLTGVAQVWLAVVIACCPIASLMALTMLVAAYTLADGAIRVVAALLSRDLPGWGWKVLGGIVGIVASVLVITALPEASFWIIGVLVGVTLVSVGAARITIALAARRAAQAN